MTPASRLDQLAARLRSGDTDAAIAEGLALVAEAADADVLTSACEVARAADLAGGGGPMAAAARMILGAALARRAHLARAIAAGGPAETLAALNAIAKARGPDAEERFAPLGALLLERDVPAFFDMGVNTDGDDAVLCWTSGAMALRKRMTGPR